jgi:hypothetical protein
MAETNEAQEDVHEEYILQLLHKMTRQEKCMQIGQIVSTGLGGGNLSHTCIYLLSISVYIFSPALTTN